MSDKWKYVSVGKCIKTIITALIMACIVFVPISFLTEAGTIFTYAKLPYVGDGTVTELFEKESNYLSLILPSLNESQFGLVTTVLQYAFYAYFIILAADILFSFVLLIFRSKIMRKMFEIFSALFGILMIVIALSSLAFVGLNVLAVLKGEATFNDIVFTGGVPLMFVMFILSIILIFKQFKFFKRPYPFSKLDDK